MPNRYFLTLIFALSFAFFLSSCSGEKKDKGPVDPPETLTLQDGLNPINKTRDYTLYADFKEGKVVGWEVHDKEGNAQEVFFETGTVKGTSMVKCQVCIETTGEGEVEDETEAEENPRKCWEIPCNSMPEEDDK